MIVGLRIAVIPLAVALSRYRPGAFFDWQYKWRTWQECPRYLALMIERIRSGWTQQADVAGTVVIRFTIERDGRITRTSVERPSGYEMLDIAARNAVAVTRNLPPLPQAFSNPTLSVHLNFQYRP